MRPARPDQLEAGARQSRVLKTRAHSATASEHRAQPSPLRARHCRPAAVRRGVRTLDVRYLLARVQLRVLMLAVMTTTARAALLQRGQQYSPDGSALISGKSSAFRRVRRVSSILLSRPTTEGDVMGDTHHDPTDHSRTTQPRAGITMKDNFL